MRSRLKILVLLLCSSASFSFYPFTGEDAGTIGERFGFEVENDLAYFRYYDGSYQQDYVFQIATGLRKNLDLALFVPYSKIWDGESIDGVGDMGFFLKHIPYQRDLKLGYKLQVNFDTGKESIGYGKTTVNLNLICEYERGEITYNVNLLYVKASHIESLRDSYGLTMAMFADYKHMITYGAELAVLSPEDRDVDKLDTHLILGLVYHLKSTDLSLGIHKSFNRDPSFADYGLLCGVKHSF